ncbi:histidine kinase [Actinoplanes sp. CA-030573]|uniref:sensor histidine kinase n=1 Tax=Actinoplanes sp. CA-030573 TaxID=3239898 RepID=UPI003D940802
MNTAIPLPASVAPTRTGVVAPRRAAGALAGITGLAVLLSVVLMVSNRPGIDALVAGHDLVGAVVALSFGAVGATVLRRHPTHALGWVFLSIALLEAIAGLGAAYAARRPTPPLAGLAGLIGDRIWFPGAIVAIALVTPLFPDGRAASKRWRPLIWVGVAVSALAFAGVWLVDLPAGRYPQWDSPLELPSPAQPALVAAVTVLQLTAAACGLLGGIALLIQMRRGTPAHRRRLGWFFVAFLVGVTGQLFDSVSPAIPLVAWALFPVGLGVAMLRYGLFDGDRLLSRTLVSIVLTVAIAGVFGFAIGLGSNWLGGESAGAVAAAVVIALGMAPARELVQRGVDRLIYGRPRDPYTVLTRLGRQLATTIAPDEVLPVVVDAVADALRLPYVAVTLTGEARPAAARGTAPVVTVDLPLLHAGTAVGTLRVGPPGGRSFLDPQDQRLLHGFAQQIGPAAYGVQLTHDLRRSRDSLATARDEERHRIRRDLHDGLGPTLAGVALGLGAARRAATTPASRELLSSLEAEVKDSLDDVKRLVADLHPTALEQVGLIAALHGYADTVTIRSGGALHVTVQAPDALRLSAEVEVAAYRIALEAVTNVTRHARATRCAVSVCVTGDDLVIQICDDGVGVPSTPPPGLGLRSIAERAAELGGAATVEAGAAGGTVVRAQLPLRTAT